MSELKETCWLLVEPTQWNKSATKPEYINGFRVKEVRQKRPAVPRGQVCVKVELTIDKGVFLEPDYIAQLAIQDQAVNYSVEAEAVEDEPEVL